VLLWVWIAVSAVALIILVLAAVRLASRLGGMHRAVGKLRRRQAEVRKVKERAEVLEQKVRLVQGRAEEVQRKIAAIAPGSGRR
jgi:Sec-independent protein translocase protein TatA